MSWNLFEDALRAEGVEGKLADLARSIYAQESGSGRNTKTSNRGAVGGMQVMPGTFRQMADPDWDIADPTQNARAGIRYLKFLDKKAGGDPALTAAGYYGGPGGLEKARRGVAVSDPQNPQAPNTLEYGQQVVARMSQGKARTAQGPVTAPVALASPATQPMAPAMGVAGAAGVESTGRVPLPQELVQYLTQRSTALGGQSPEQANAWLSFLRAMPGAPGAARQAAVAAPTAAPDSLPRSMDYASILRPVAQPQGRVDFRRFGAFGSLV